MQRSMSAFLVLLGLSLAPAAPASAQVVADGNAV
jgi:hypothetical protein